ncbi:hypothetical protein PCE1_001135 [Barthelona sp. PCE]
MYYDDDSDWGSEGRPVTPHIEPLVTRKPIVRKSETKKLNTAKKSARDIRQEQDPRWKTTPMPKIERITPFHKNMIRTLHKGDRMRQLSETTRERIRAQKQRPQTAPMRNKRRKVRKVRPKSGAYYEGKQMKEFESLNKTGFFFDTGSIEAPADRRSASTDYRDPLKRYGRKTASLKVRALGKIPKKRRPRSVHVAIHPARFSMNLSVPSFVDAPVLNPKGV